MKNLLLITLLLCTIVTLGTAQSKDANGCLILGPTDAPDYFGGCFPNYATSPILQKFVAPVPSIPIAHPDTLRYPGTDYYEIELREYGQQMHPQLPATRLRGYVQVNNGTDATGQNTLAPAPIQYLGPIIVANSGKPVRVKFVNNLPPSNGGGDLFIPTDTTYMGAGMGPGGGTYTQNRATLHLHGGTTPWISDGTPHQWITPAGEVTVYPKGVSVQNVPDMEAQDPCNAVNSGCQTFFYSNQQSARLMFYHDHAYGITRLNVYAGEAAGYLLTDGVEADLINGTNVTGANPSGANILPGVGIPLVIQDKTFVPDNTGAQGTYANLVGTFPSQLAAQDPTWDTTKWGGPGSLWYPHVYMPNQNPGDLSGANPMGRWDYGPWFWPPFVPLTFGPVSNPYFDPTCVSGPTTYCVSPEIPGTPDSMLSASGVKGPSGVPEAFMDTPLVNGMAYPTLDVPASVVRFRILNAANDRFWNLSLFVAADKNTPTTAGTSGAALCTGNVPVANCTEVKMVPFNSAQNTAQPFPSWWYDSTVPNPFDDRTGGVPDPATRGPAMIQIGTEGGLLPAPAVINNQPVNYVMNKRDITVGNVKEHALLLGPAERADVLVDFSSFAGQTLILYSDAPAPVPAADPRIDYFTGDVDQSDVGGAPSTQPGFGPNTRTIMQIRVAGSGGTGAPDALNSTLLSQLKTVLPLAFNKSQDTIIVPQAPYNAAYNGNFPGGTSAYVKIADTAFSFTPINAAAAVTANLEPKSIIEDFQMDYGRMNAILGVEIPRTNNTNQTSIPQAYIDPPTEVINFSQGKFVAANGAQLGDGTQLWKVTHNGVDTHAMHFHMFNVQVINRVGWDGAIRPPDPNELGWKDTIRTNPLEDVIVALRPIQLTNLPFPLPNSKRPMDVTQPTTSPLTGFNLDPLSGNGITPPLNDVTNFGWEYVWHCHLLGHEENDMMRSMALAVPPEAPSNLAASVINGNVNLTFTDNSLSEASFTIERADDANFTVNRVVAATVSQQTGYGTVVPTSDAKNPIPGAAYYYRAYATGETVGSTVPNYPNITPVSTFSNVASVAAAPVASVTPPSLQFGNQVQGTPSAAKTVTLSNIGTAQLNFTDTISAGDFALDQASTTCGSSLIPNASCTIGVVFTPTATGASTGSLTITSNDPANGTMTVALSGTGVVPPPSAPVLTANATGPFQVSLSWTGGSGATGFRISRTQGANPAVTVAQLAANATSYNDTTVKDGTAYTYQVFAFNNTGSTGSNPVSVTTPVAPPSNLLASISPTQAVVVLNWTNNSQTATSITIQRAGNTTFTAGLKTYGPLAPNTSTWSGNSLVLGSTYCYRVMASNATGNSAWSNVSCLVWSAPAAPSGLSATNVTRSSVTLTWADNSNNEGGFTIQRATNNSFTQGLTTITTGAGATSYTNTGLRNGTRYYYRVRSFNGAGTSGWSNAINTTTLP